MISSLRERVADAEQRAEPEPRLMKISVVVREPGEHLTSVCNQHRAPALRLRRHRVFIP